MALAAPTIPKILNYQAHITNASGVPVPDGNLNIWISLYNAASGGSCLYAMRGSCGTPTWKTVTVTNGVFSTLIGDQNAGDNEIPDTVFQNTGVYLGITVASDTEMVPRKRVVTAPFTENADMLDGLDTTSSGSSTAYVPSTTANGNLVITGDPQGSGIGNGSVYINPALASAGETLFGVADNGSLRFKIAKEGGVALTGSLLASAASSTSQFVFRGAASQSNNIFEVQDGSLNRVLMTSATGTTITNLTVTGTCTGCSGGTTNLDQAYLASTSSAEISLTPSIGALTIADTFSGTGDIFEVQDRSDSAGDYSARYLTVSSTSTLVGDTIDSYKLGLGTAAPSYKLDVNGTSGIRVTGPSIYGLTFKSTDPTSDFSGMKWTDNADTSLWTMGNDFNGNGNQDFWLYDAVNGRTVLLADQSGSSYLSFGTSNGGFQYDNSTQRLDWFTNGTLKTTLTSGGNFGISNTAPANQFTVGTTSTFEVDANGNLIKVRNVPYSWPASQGGVSTVLQNNGSGTLSWAASGSSNLNQAYLASTSSAEISLSPSIGALTIADTFSGIGDIFEIQNRTDSAGDYSLRYLTVSSTSTNLGGDLLPTADNTYNLGSSALRWKTLNVGPGSVVVHNDATNTLKATLDFSGSTARLVTDAATPLQITTGANSGISVATNGFVGINNASPANTFTVGTTSTLEVDPNGNLLKIRNVPYSWSASQGAASTFLQNDGSGNLTWVVGTPSTLTLQSAYDNDVNGGDVTITTNSTDGQIIIAGDQNFRVNSTGSTFFGNNTHTSTDVVTVNGSALTTGDALMLNGGNDMSGSGAILNATGTKSNAAPTNDGLFKLQANISRTGAAGSAGGMEMSLNDLTYDVFGGGELRGYDLTITDNAFNAHNQFGYRADIVQNNGSPSDNTWEALYYANNADTATGNQITVTNGYWADNNGGTGMTNAFNAAPTSGTITNGFRVSGGTVTNGINFTGGSAMTTDFIMQNGETIDNNVDGVINTSATTFQVTPAVGTGNAFNLAGSNLTSGNGLFLTGGNDMSGSGAIINATGTHSDASSTNDGLFKLQANITRTGASTGNQSSGMETLLSDLTYDAFGAGELRGYDLTITDNAFNAHSQYGYRADLLANGGSPSDNTWEALFYANNEDTATGNQITVTNGFRADNTSGTTGMTNGFNAAPTSGTITNGFRVSGGTVTNGINFSGATAMTTDFIMQNGESLDNDVDGTINTVSTFQDTPPSGSANGFVLAGSNLTSGNGLFLTGGNDMSGSGAIINATGTHSDASSTNDGLFKLQANITRTGASTGNQSSGMEMLLNDSVYDAFGVGEIRGYDLAITDNAFITHTQFGYRASMLANNGSPSDNTWESLFYANNADTATGNQITVTNGFLADETGAVTGMTNAFNAAPTSGTITNGFRVSGGTVTNGINFTGGNAMTTDFIMQNGETIDNNVDGTINTSANIFQVTPVTTTNNALFVNGGQNTTGTLFSATGTAASGGASASGHGLVTIQANIQDTGTTTNLKNSGLLINLNDITQSTSGQSIGSDIEITANSFGTASVHGHYGYAATILANNGTPTDNVFDALYFADNEDTTGGNQIVVTDGYLVTSNAGGTPFTNGFDIAPTNGTVTNGFVVNNGGGGGIVTNGINFSAGNNMTTDFIMQNGESIDNNVNGIINTSADTFQVTPVTVSADALRVAGSNVTTGNLLQLNGGQFTTGTLMSATGTIASTGNANGYGLINIQANIANTGATTNLKGSGVLINMNDINTGNAGQSIGEDIEITENSYVTAVPHSHYAYMANLNANNASPGDNTFTALYYADNNDTATGNQIVVTSGYMADVTSGGSGAMTNGFLATTNASGGMTNGFTVKPSGTMTNGFAIGTGGTVTNGINFTGTGSVITTDFIMQNGESIDNNTDGTINLTANTTQVSPQSATLNALTIAGTNLTSGNGIFVNGGQMNGGALISATGTMTNNVNATAAGLVTIQENGLYPGQFTNTDFSSGMLVNMNDVAQGTCGAYACGGSMVGYDLEVTMNSFSQHDKYGYRARVAQNNGSPTDNVFQALYYADNADTATGNQLTVTDGFRASVSGGVTGMTNGFDVNPSSGTITNGFAIGNTGVVTNGISFSGASSVVTNDFVMQNGETISNNTDGNINFTDGTNNLMSILDNGTTGSVGISLTSPATRLDVAGTLQASVASLQGTTGNNAIATDYVHGSGGFVPGMIWYSTDNNPTLPKAGFWMNDTVSGSNIQFGTSNSYSSGITNTAMTIDPSGNVGIGDTTPLSPLTVGSGDLFRVTSSGQLGIGGLAPAVNLDVKGTVQATAAGLQGTTANNSIAASYARGGSGGFAPGLIWYSTDDNATKPKGGIWLDDTNTGSLMQFGTSNTYTSGITNTALTINQNGNIGVGTTTPGARFVVQDANASPTANIFQLTNANDSTRYMTVSSTATLLGDAITAYKLGISNSAPANAFTVGSTSTLEVDANGNLLKIRNVAYSWPASQGAASTVLTNNGSGTLSWTAGNSLTTLQNAYDNDVNGGDVTIATNSTDGALILGGDQNVDFTTSGNVGIDTTNPLFSLDFGTNTANDQISLYNDGTTGYVYGMGVTGGVFNFNIAHNLAQFSFWDDAAHTTELFRINGNGALDVTTVNTSTNGLCHSTSGTGFDEMVDCSGTPSDVAEWYPSADASAAAKDILVATDASFTYQERLFDPSTGLPSGATGTYEVAVLDRSSVPYDPRIVGIVSTSPNQTYGEAIRDSAPHAVPMALAGRVPMRVTYENGPIKSGDPITTSSTAGAGMKATKPGMIVGYALGSWNGAGEGIVQVLVQPGWHSGMTIGTDGVSSLFNDDFGFAPKGLSSASGTSFSSYALNFKTSTWDAASNTAVARDISVMGEATDAADYQLAFRNNDGNLLASLNQSGDLSLAGSLSVNGGFDYAEQFPAAPDLDAGDIVMVDPSNSTGYGVKKSSGKYENTLVGVISTKPGFLTGKAETGSDPVALAGRVPVKVSMENGAIKPGDPITSSSKPGVGMKATEAGRVVGIALQGFDGSAGNSGTVLMFVNPSWWNGPMPIGATTASSGLNVTQDSLLDFKNSTLSGVAAIVSTSGAWSITSDGVLTAHRVEAQSMETEALTVKQTDQNAVISEGTIPAGYTAVVIQNPAMTPQAEVFISFRSDPKGGYWVAERGEGNFTVHLTQAAASDLSFAYWIVGVDDLRTPKSPSTDLETSATNTASTPEAAPGPAASDSGTTTSETPTVPAP